MPQLTRHVFSTVITFTFLPIALYAQQFTFKGTVTDSAGAAVPAAALSLLRASDSSWIQSRLSDDTGAFAFNGIAAGNYLLNIQALGYPKTVKAVTISEDVQSVNIVLARSNLTLQEVSVTDQRPFIEAQPGKMVINLEQSLNTGGNTVLDLLRKSPGVSVSASGSIGMQGKQGVMVYINDKPAFMSGDELAQYLNSMQADQVSQLELITQPSSKYDAEGNAGIINIKMKRIKKRGFNGTLSGTYLQGRFPIYDATLRLNYRNNDLNFSVRMTKAYNHGFLTQDLKRNFRDPGTYALTGTMNQHMYLWERARGYHFDISADYALTQKTIIGTNVWLNLNPVPYGSTTDAVIFDQNTNTQVNNHAEFSADQLRKRATTNAFLRHAFAKNNELHLSMDYLKYWMLSEPGMTNTDKNEAGSDAFPPLILRGQLPMNIDVYSTRADYNVKSGKSTLETGIKSSYVRTENEAAYEIWQKDVWAYDSLRNNHFLYIENINAAYANITHALAGRWDAQAGLRIENTNAKGKQSVMNHTFTRHYTSLFPTAYIAYKADSNHQFELNYGRRIQRPEYRALNPFIKFISQYNYDMGNPSLQPQFAHNIELNHSYRNALFTALNCNHVTGVRQFILVVDDSSKITYSKPMNVGTNDNLGVSIMYNKEVKSRWEFSFSGNLYYSWYSGVVSAKRVKVSGPGYAVNINNQFSFGSTWTTQVLASYDGLSRTSVLGYTGGWFYTEFSISKKLFDEKLRITLRAEDPFYIARYSVKYHINEIDGDAIFFHNSRKAGVNILYTFGKRWDRRNSNNTGIGEESGRIR